MTLIAACPKKSVFQPTGFLRSQLLDPSAPNPSVETLLHAFLPGKFVDHTHSAAILSLTNQPNGEAICRDLFGEKASVLPYVMPGFQLAKDAASLYESDPQVKGMVLHKHGLFTFGDTAKESYDRMIDLVTFAEDYAGRLPPKVFISRVMPKSVAVFTDVAPIVRGACAIEKDDEGFRRWIIDFRTSKAIRNYVDGNDLHDYATRGVITPDHNIRTKNKPLVLPVPDADDLEGFAAATRQAVQQYRSNYDEYFAKHNARQDSQKTRLDSMPRVVLVPGVGLFGLGKSAKDANVVSDLSEITVETVTNAERIGQFEALSESDLFEMEYWSLEQAKLGKGKGLPLQGQVAVVTGGGGAIGTATALLFAKNGAEIAVPDVDGEKAHASAEAIRQSTGIQPIALACDVTKPTEVADAFNAVVGRFGGVDIVVSNAGAAWQGEIGTLDDAILRKSFELNFFAHQYIAQNAVRVMRAQGTGGVLLFNASKQAVNPGPNFGSYGLPKAATMLLSRQYGDCQEKIV